jgi:hypothetical protein
LPSAITWPPVSVDASSTYSAPSAQARAIASPSTMRPSASVLNTSTRLPLNIVITSPGRYAEPDGMFSAIAR